MPEITAPEIVPLTDPAPTRGPWGTRIGRIAVQGMILWILLAVVIPCQILYPGFFDIQNIFNMLSQHAPVGIIAAGMTFVMVSGGFDLSVGPMYAAGATVFAIEANAMPIWAAAIVTILVGMAGGLINGMIVCWLRVNPFVATLGTSSIFAGGAFLYSHSSPIMVSKPGFSELGAASWLGVPISVELTALVFVLGGIVLAKTVYGRMLYSVGGNPEASRLAGLRVDLLCISTYVLVATLSVVGGMIIASRLSIGQADIAGSMSLDAIAVVIIGGTSLFGGYGAIWRTAVGLLLLAVLTNLFDALAMDVNFQSLIKGIIIIGAVALDVLTNRRTGMR